MIGPYDDILFLPHPVSKTHKPMSQLDRAAQFSPFAALTGYDAAIQEAARLTEDAVELDTEEIAVLNEILGRLADRISSRPRITVTYFLPDIRKAGGAYTTVTGRLKRVDPVEQVLGMADGTVIPFRYLREISCGESEGMQL